MMLKKLRQVRRLRGYTQEELAIKIGLSQSVFSKKENGLVVFTVQEAFTLSKILECDIDVFYN